MGVSRVVSLVGDALKTTIVKHGPMELAPLVDSEVLISSASHIGVSLSSSIAALKNIPVVQDIIEIEDGLTIMRPIYSGKAIEKSKINPPCAITLRANSFEPAGEGGEADSATVNSGSISQS